jgi:hypothetical protein
MTFTGRSVACLVVAIAVALPAVLVRAADVELAPTVHHPMSRYVDAKYRFSFWHLSALRIAVTAANDDARFPGGVTVETVQVGSPGGVSLYVVIRRRARSPTNPTAMRRRSRRPNIFTTPRRNAGW